jgi:hypothetical protein
MNKGTDDREIRRCALRCRREARRHIEDKLVQPDAVNQIVTTLAEVRL